MEEQLDKIFRLCKKCGVEKPLTEFTISYGCTYNRTHTCKVCYNNVFDSDYKKKKAIEHHLEVKKKICTKCGIEKNINEFHANSQRNDGHSSICLKCQAAYMRNYKKDPQNYTRIKESRKKYYQDNKELWISFRETESYKKYRESDHYKDISRTQSRQYYKEHKTTCNKKSVECHLRLRKKNNKVKLRDNVRSHIWRDIKRGRFSVTTAEMIGCDFNKFYDYIESLFLPGMSWDNYGFYGWHLDHIIPLSSFDSDDIEQQKKAWNFTNLRPLWAIDNLRKGVKIIAA